MGELLVRPGRCPVCEWPLAENREQGCVPDNCSYRPEQGSAEYWRIHRRRAALAVLKERDAAAQRDMQEVEG